MCDDGCNVEVRPAAYMKSLPNPSYWGQKKADTHYSVNSVSLALSLYVYVFNEWFIVIRREREREREDEFSWNDEQAFQII